MAQGQQGAQVDALQGEGGGAAVRLLCSGSMRRQEACVLLNLA